jgi:hypothetical protein
MNRAIMVILSYSLGQLVSDKVTATSNVGKTRQHDGRLGPVSMLEKEEHLKEPVAHRTDMRIVSRIITILYSYFSWQSRFFKIGASILKGFFKFAKYHHIYIET